MRTTREEEARERRSNAVVAGAAFIGAVAAMTVLFRVSPDAIRIVAGPSQVSAALRSCGR